LVLGLLATPTCRHLYPGPLRHGRSGPGLSRTRHAHRPPSPDEPAAVVHRVSVKGKLAALVPSGPLVVGSGVVEGQGELLAGSRAVLGRYVVMSSGVVKPSRMSQV
jgi:hypothetical protein